MACSSLSPLRGGEASLVFKSEGVVDSSPLTWHLVSEVQVGFDVVQCRRDDLEIDVIGKELGGKREDDVWRCIVQVRRWLHKGNSKSKSADSATRG